MTSGLRRLEFDFVARSGRLIRKVKFIYVVCMNAAFFVACLSKVYSVQASESCHDINFRRDEVMEKAGVDVQITKDSIGGTWHLKSFNILFEDGTWKPWGKDVAGLLIYTPDDYVSVAINRNIGSSRPQR
ncbi:MAG: hypothetical protein C5B49_11160 [Bdellovibrio sp.]|nr:MAG: hypothetical protein C5B49_11160 [Bdellovibrio sp.]